MFDNLLDPEDSHAERLQTNLAAARDAGIEIIEVSSILRSSPERERFSCLDHIHMTEPYHRLMAKQWLKALLNQAVLPKGGARRSPCPDRPCILSAYAKSTRAR